MVTFKILKATYGKGDQLVDVTRAIKQLSTTSGLRIAKVSNEAVGAGPVQPGVRKQLTVLYRSTSGETQEAHAWERNSLTIQA